MNMKFEPVRKGGCILLIDPDKQPPAKAGEIAATAEAMGVKAIFVGSSIILEDKFNETVHTIKKACKIPIVLFPGASNQVSKEVDTVLFLSLISGRNPEFLIGEQVKAAPIIYKYGIHTLPTAYLLIEGGKTTSVEFMSNTKPLPREKPDIIVAHALAAEYLGMKLIYLEAGSGAKDSVPDEVIAAVRKHVKLPLIVGGGIRTPEDAIAKIAAGADYLVIGTRAEEDWAAFEKIVKAVNRALKG